MLGSSPLRVTLWLVTREVSNVVVYPWDAVGPYSTWLVDDSSVVQVITVPVLVVLEAAGPTVMVGGVVSGVAVVVNVPSAEIDSFPAASFDFTR